MQNNRSQPLTKEMIEQHQLSTAPPPKDSLFWQCWNASKDIAQKAFETNFIQGIKTGTLDPTTYGRYNVSDAYYCFKGADDYALAASNSTDPVLKAFFQQRHESYVSYNNSFPDKWHIKSGESISPSQVCKEYSDFETTVAKDRDTIYLLFAMLPCDYLWPWLAEKCKPVAKGNLYASWVTDNGDPSGAYAKGNFIEGYRENHPIDADKAISIYQQAMTYEWGNFETA